MYAGFELTSLDFEDFEDFYEIGRKSFDKYNGKVKKTLEEFTNANGSLNGDKMQSAWFPNINADIFLSHSHDDEDLVIAFAGWLKHTFDVNVFIDSCIWGYSKDLQELIDKEHKVIWRDNNYKKWIDYNKVQYSASHVHMMLNTALMQTIDACECVIFLNTPHSVKPEEVIDKVVSPWIYSELAMTKLVRKKELKEYRIQQLLESDRSFSDKLNIEYNLDTDHLIKISIDDLIKWQADYQSIPDYLKREFNNNALDYLYKLKEVK